MDLAKADIWIERRDFEYYVRMSDGEFKSEIGSFTKADAIKVHNHLGKAVQSAKVQPIAYAKHSLIKNADAGKEFAKSRVGVDATLTGRLRMHKIQPM